VKWAYLKTSPAKDVALAREPDGRVRYLTFEEREKLLNGAHETVESRDGRRWTVHHKPSAALRQYVLAALQTGARRAELLRLTWGDVDMKRRTVTFRKTKNGRDRTVPMTETLREMLQTLPRPLDPAARVLPSYEPLALTRSFTRLVKRLGLTPLTFHDLRHDAASTLTMAGVSQRAIMEILGHRDPRMTTPATSTSHQGTFTRLFEPLSSRPRGSQRPSLRREVALFRHRRKDAMRVVAQPRVSVGGRYWT